MSDITDQIKEEVAQRIRDARSFMVSEFSDKWESAERYVKGECDLAIVDGRSTIVKTVTNDVMRAIMPSIMRVLLQSRKPVEYWPNNIRQSAFVEQQSMWVNQMFTKNNGYKQLYAAVSESLKLNAGPLKVYWLENAKPTHFKVTGITTSEVLEYVEQPDVVVDKVTQHVYGDNSPFQGTDLVDIECTQYYTNGKIVIEAIPMYEFFHERSGTDVETCLHGHARLVTVSEALEMGIEYDDFPALCGSDPETSNFGGASVAKRDYQLDGDTPATADPTQDKFLLAEAYAEYDMDDTGYPCKYVFYMGGENHTYLHHEKIEDFPIAVTVTDPVTFGITGRSLPELTKQHQDTQTSLLRAMIDNAHIANNPRAAADPTKVDFNDLMNNAIGAPIKTKGQTTIQLFDVPFTAGNLLPLLEALNRDVEERTGITKAAQGLDPDALQSTDKQAVMNTIQLSQGQIELYVRNIVETGLIPLFRKVLRLSLRHVDSIQMLRFKGAMVPINIANFDADLLAEPNVGLGTMSPQAKLQTLSFVYQEQQKYMERFGLDNPFTSLSQVYNTIEDMIELGGIPNVGRYFNFVGKAEEQQIAKGLAEAAAKAAEEAAVNAPVDPSKALIAIESGKRKVDTLRIASESRTKELDMQQRSLYDAEKLDLERDKMRQDRVIEFSKLRAADATREKDLVREQNAATQSAQTSAREPGSTGRTGEASEQ